MARIRSIKPEAFKSETLSQLDYFTRWTFAGLWTYLDDFGYGRADARLVRAEVFPLDDDATPAKVNKALDALTAAGSVCRFMVDDREYIHAPAWQDHQKVSRPSKSKFPPCPEHDNGPSGTVSGNPTADAMNPIEDSRGNTVGKGTGNREQGTSSADADGDFTAFWSEYPKKVAKPDAQRAWVKAARKAELDVIMAGLRRHLPTWAKSEIKFVPNAATWLNGERWNDVLEQPTRRDNRPEGW